MPAADSLPLAARLADRIVENPGAVTLVLDARLSCEPGQFAMLWLPGLDEKPFSIAGDDPLMFTARSVGPFSEALCSLAPGERLWFRGPFGRGFSSVARRPLLVGGGYGAAPLYFLARRLSAAGATPVCVALGAKTGSELLFAERFAGLGCDVHLATDDGSRGASGLVTSLVGGLPELSALDRIYACGPELMLDALAAFARARSLPAELSYEAYMRCGIGLCGSCTHGPRLACLDGPVFDV